MSDPSRRKRSGPLYSGRKMRVIGGTKWEYPIPKSKEYWEKFCDDAERKFIKVREDTYSKLSYSAPDNKSLDYNSLGDSYRSNGKSENSMREISALKISPVTPSRTGNPTAGKFRRIPKLDAVSSQPSFSKISSGNIVPARRPTAEIISRSNLQTADKSSRIPTKLTSGKSEAMQQDFLPTIEQSPTNRHSLKYMVRCAYKALKLRTPNKKLNFEPIIVERSDRSAACSRSSSSESIDGVERGKEESLYFRDVHKRLKKVWLKNRSLDAELGSTLASDDTVSMTMSTGTRFTSGTSPVFVYPEPGDSRSARVLARIPKLSGFPRRNCDRCLSCMCKSFEKPGERKVSLPRTILRRSTFPSKECAMLFRDVSRNTESSSVSPNFGNEVDRIPNYEVETKDVRFQEDFQTLPGVASKVISSSFPVKREEVTGKSNEKYTTESDTRQIKSAVEGNDRGNDSKPVAENVDEIKASSVSVSMSQERSKISFSTGEGTSDEDESLVASVAEDPSKSRYLAPCHAPTVLRPSLEPLRALKLRKPTTLQARIDFNEATSVKKTISDDDEYDDVPEKPKPISNDREKFELASVADDRDKDKKQSRVLKKTQSASEKLTLSDAEAVLRTKQQLLRKGSSSLSLLTIPKDEASVRRDESAPPEVGSIDSATSQLLAVDSSKMYKELPLTRVNEIVEILENVDEKTPSNMLDVLCKEFSVRVSKDLANANVNARKRRKMVANLTKLLVDSKRYLNPDKFSSNLFFSTNQPPLCNPRQLRRILPLRSYNLIAPVLGMPKWYPKRVRPAERVDMKRQRISKRPSSDGISFDLEVHPPTLKDELIEDEEDKPERKYNPYALFLKKPKRKAVTWRPLADSDLKGYDPDATLKMRVDNMMQSICHDFCQWLESLGGTENVVDEEVLRDMFEIDFKAEACRAMQISIQEMPMVPTEVAVTRNSLNASKLAMTNKHLIRDAKAERMPAKIRAFGSGIPWELQFVPPNNQVEKRWLQCENVPRELETMEVVWKGITHLDSVRGFVEWLHEHPEVQPPEALKTIASMDVNTFRQTEDDETFAHLELDMNQIGSLKVGGGNAL